MARLAFWDGGRSVKGLEGARKALPIHDGESEAPLVSNRKLPILLKPSRGAGFGGFVPILKGARIGTESDANRAHLAGQCRPLGGRVTAQAGTRGRGRLDGWPALAKAAAAARNPKRSTRKARRIRDGESDAARLSESDASDSAKTQTWRGFQAFCSAVEWGANPSGIRRATEHNRHGPGCYSRPVLYGV